MIKPIFYSLVLLLFTLTACDSGPNGGSMNDSQRKADSRRRQDSIAHISIGAKPIQVQSTGIGDSTIYEGDVLMRYPNGVIMVKGAKAGGKRVGQWVTFHENGNVWSEGFYRNGMREGKGVSYYENGKKSSEGSYKASKLVGVWSYWDTLGHVVKYDMGDGTQSPKAVQ